MNRNNEISTQGCVNFTSTLMKLTMYVSNNILIMELDEYNTKLRCRVPSALEQTADVLYFWKMDGTR